jgi:hypothetical protein
MKQIWRTASALTIAGAAIALAGCGGSGGSAASPAGGGTTSLAASASSGSGSASSSGQGGSSTAGLSANIDICSLMPKEVIARIVGKPFNTVERQNTPSYKLYDCNYTSKVTSTGGGDQLDLGVVGMDGSVGYNADLSAMSGGVGHATPVPGIGDKAFTSGVMAQLEVLYGNVVIKITGLTSPTIAQDKEIISGLHAKL